MESNFKNCCVRLKRLLPTELSTKQKLQLFKEHSRFKKVKNKKGKLYQCILFPKYVFYSQSLIYHMLSHTNERAYKCTTCGKTSKTKKRLKIHQRVHTGEKPYFWSKCPLKYSTSSELKNQVGKVHGNNLQPSRKEFKCVACSKKFYTAGSLRQHSKIHSGFKPFGCAICGHFSVF